MRRAIGPCLVGAALGLYGTVGVARGDPPSQRVAAPVYEYPGQQGYGAEPATAPASPDQPQARSNAWDYQRPCNQPETREQADLCQQWRMAKASEDLIGWARWQFWVTAGEIGLLVMTVTFTGWAAYGARKAAVETRRAANAAIEANKISSELGIRQIRAYVNLSSASINEFKIGQQPVIELRIKNGGQTPAAPLRMAVQVNIGARPDVLRFKSHNRMVADRSVVTLSHGAHIERDIPIPAILNEDLHKAISKGSILIIVMIMIAYVDVFRRPRRTRVKLLLEAESLRYGKGAFRAYHEGNRST